MTLDEFHSAPLGSLNAPLRALREDAAGRWEDAHREIQDDPSRNAAWVHAYLHRKEGDSANAGYWYARAGRPLFAGSLEDEWQAIARELAREV